MRRPGEEDSAEPGDHAAERLREFLAKRLPPGASTADLNAELAKLKAELKEPDPPSSSRSC